MAKIIDGTPVDAATTNAALLGRQADDTATGVIGLNNTTAASGAALTNIQREMNSLDSFTGNTPNQVYNSKPAYSNNEGFGVNDDLRTRTDSVSGKFNSSSGHAHTGTAGDAPPVSSSHIAPVYLKTFIAQGVNLSAVSGLTFDVSTQLSGSTPSSGSTIKGVVINAPYNRIALRSANDSIIADGSGNEVYARLTNSGSTWTLTFFVDLAGTETAYTLPLTATVKWYYTKLINPIADAGYEYSSPFVIPSDNATADVVDASTTQRGLVNTGAQSFSGKKEFQGGVKLESSIETPESIDSTTTGAGASLAPIAPLIRITNGSLVSINNISSPTDGKQFILINGTGINITIINNSGGTPVNRIRTGTGSNLSMANDSSLIFCYDAATSLWQVVGGSGSGGGGSGNYNAYDITSGGTIVLSGTTSAPTKGTVVTDQVYYGRNGQFADFTYKYYQSAAGSGGSGDTLFQLPNSLQFNTSLVSLYTAELGAQIIAPTSAQNFAFIQATGFLVINSSTNRGPVWIIPYDSTHFRVMVQDLRASGTNYCIGSGGNNMWADASGFGFTFSAPISGWTSGTTGIIEAYSREVHGTFAAPILINPTVGIVPSIAMDQTWYLAPTTSGSHLITASPAIAPGTILGQRLILKGTSPTDYLGIPDASGTNQNGFCNLVDNQAIVYEWDGANWNENGRRQ
jgi:hypothetical protein